MSLRTIRRRRRECKTDYKARLSLVQSGIPRLVVRRTNRFIIVQAVESKGAQDKVLATVNSRELLKYGLDKKFAGSLKSLSAAYLAGILMTKKIKKGEYIIDMGMAINHSGGRIYACVKGLVDGGLKINANEKIFPSEDRIMGKHLKPEVQKNLIKVKENILKNGK